MLRIPKRWWGITILISVTGSMLGLPKSGEYLSSKGHTCDPIRRFSHCLTEYGPLEPVVYAENLRTLPLFLLIVCWHLFRRPHGIASHIISYSGDWSCVWAKKVQRKFSHSLDFAFILSGRTLGSVLRLFHDFRASVPSLSSVELSTARGSAYSRTDGWPGPGPPCRGHPTPCLPVAVRRA